MNTPRRDKASLLSATAISIATLLVAMVSIYISFGTEALRNDTSVFGTSIIQTAVAIQATDFAEPLNRTATAQVLILAQTQTAVANLQTSFTIFASQTAQPSKNNLLMFIDRNIIAFRVKSSDFLPISGLQLEVMSTSSGATPELLKFSDIFGKFPGVSTALWPNSCYVFQVIDSSVPLPALCQQSQTFITQVALSSAFWYDVPQNSFKYLILKGENFQTIGTCSADSAICSFNIPSTSLSPFQTPRATQ